MKVNVKYVICIPDLINVFLDLEKSYKPYQISQSLPMENTYL